MAKLPRPRQVPVDFSVDPDFLLKGLTSDVSTIECVYDLIDNSIDAARNEILGRPSVKKDAFGLPACYFPYEIKIRFSGNSFEIEDNCSGISEDDLVNRSFRTGVRSSHRYGIGHFGVGLNRSIFKMGSSFELITDDGKTFSHLKFTEDDVRNLKEKSIVAEVKKTQGPKSNLLKIFNIRPEVENDLVSEYWRKVLIKSITERYGRFVEKGLVIDIDGHEIESFGPKIRKDGALPPVSEKLNLKNGVKFFLEAGMHSQYQLAKGGIAANRRIAPEYGWYVVCNDRIILAANRSAETGWTTVWHNEYSGFIGWAFYVSEDPSKLPWDSKKTSINTHSPAHVETVAKLKQAADNFRAKNRKLIKNVTPPTPPGNPGTNPAPSGPRSPSTPAAPVPPPANRLPHSSNFDNVFVDCDVTTRLPKISSLVIEAANTSIPGFPYRAAFMLRSLFEQCLNDYLRRHKHVKAIRDHWLLEIQKVKTLTPEQIKNFSVTLDQTLVWVLSNKTSIWPAGHENTCHRGCELFKGHLPRLNGVVHETGRLIDESLVRKIRDDIMSALVVILTN